MLRPHGLLYVSSVVRKRYGFWIYWRKGFKLDPTHVREYGLEEEFLKLLEKAGFTILSVNTTPINYPVTDLAIRILIRIGAIRPDPLIYFKHKLLRFLRRLAWVRVPGYRVIEVVAIKMPRSTW